uniref:Uncharacterized protein n=1 Tax=Anguilla anguilla TaxID=7936 RepID=A0A0E9PI28_ANGAN
MSRVMVEGLDLPAAPSAISVQM